jgi:hypothetical protein
MTLHLPLQTPRYMFIKHSCVSTRPWGGAGDYGVTVSCRTFSERTFSEA